MRSRHLRYPPSNQVVALVMPTGGALIFPGNLARMVGTIWTAARTVNADLSNVLSAADLQTGVVFLPMVFLNFRKLHFDEC